MATTDDDIKELIREIHADRIAAKRQGEARELDALRVAHDRRARGRDGDRLAQGGRVRQQGHALPVPGVGHLGALSGQEHQAAPRRARVARPRRRARREGRRGRRAATASRRRSVEAKAQGLEAARDEAARHGPPLGFAIASLQISIALASVCLITKRKGLWAAAGVLGLVGIGYLVYGLLRR